MRLLTRCPSQLVHLRGDHEVNGFMDCDRYVSIKVRLRSSSLSLSGSSLFLMSLRSLVIELHPLLKEGVKRAWEI